MEIDVGAYVFLYAFLSVYDHAQYSYNHEVMTPYIKKKTFLSVVLTVMMKVYYCFTLLILALLYSALLCRYPREYGMFGAPPSCHIPFYGVLGVIPELSVRATTPDYRLNHLNQSLVGLACF